MNPRLWYLVPARHVLPGDVVWHDGTPALVTSVMDESHEGVQVDLDYKGGRLELHYHRDGEFMADLEQHAHLLTDAGPF